MQDLACDDPSLMNNENSSSVKTIDSCVASLALGDVIGIAPGDNTDPDADLTNAGHNLNDFPHKYSGSLLRGIKLEDAQGSPTVADDFFSTAFNPQTVEIIKSECDRPPPPATIWPQTQPMFSRPEVSTRPTTTITKTTTTSVSQLQKTAAPEDLQQNFQATIRPRHHHNHHHHLNHIQKQQQHSHYHHHHQLLLQSSDDPLISHGSESVINDDDQSVELKNLMTAATSGQQIQQKQQQQQQQQQQKQQQQQHNSKQHRVIANGSGQVQKRLQNGCSSLTKQQLKVKAGLMSAAQKQLKQAATQGPTNSHTNPTPTRAKPKSKKKVSNTANSTTGNGAIKLRFHHQALPPEYLSHYEATQRQLRQNEPLSAPSPTKESRLCVKASTSTAVKVAQTAKLPPPKSSHENVRSWLQKIAEIQRAAQQRQQPAQKQTPSTPDITSQRTPPAPPHDANNNHQSCRMSSLQSALPLPAISSATVERNTLKTAPQTVAGAPSAPSKTRIMNYADLPYMGEITLNNSKPRRGRKPKKADICHLIYKNYGTIFADVSNRPPGAPQSEFSRFQLESKKHTNAGDDEPLNLCLRDYQSLDLYSVSSGEGNCDAGEETGFNDDVSESGDTHSNCTTPGDALTDTMLATNMKTAMPSLEELSDCKPHDADVSAISSKDLASRYSDDEPTKLLLHPVRAYYEKLLKSGVLVRQNDGSLPSAFTGFSGLPIETIEKDNQIALKIPIPSGLFVASKLESKAQSTPLEYPESLSTPSSIKSEQSFTTTTSSNVTGSYCNGASAQANATPQKRKRSAIFIPPMPAENTTNPANEVSICKFKFTGGVKPTLQEKKMLSVDSDGNYRYYSGTGDKSMRGYEFFPRESLQQSGFLPGVGGAGAFLNATGEKISMDIPPPSSDLSNELLQIPDSPTGTLLLPTSTGVSAMVESTRSASNRTTHSPLSSMELNARHKRTQPTAPYDNATPAASSLLYRKKKSHSSRRPSQREKLERTFKEKGFLIQTQHLESAEGATYCKFRQLKKFTRYLFRNWKDYLPDGQILQSQGVGNAAGQQAAIESLLAEHGFDARQAEMSNNPHIEATEIVETDPLTGTELERV